MAAEATLTGLVFLKPILVFLSVFLIMAALLIKTKLFGDGFFFPIAVSFVMASVFAAAGGARTFLAEVIPWLAVLLLGVFFIVILMAFIGKQNEVVGKGLGWVFVIIIFLIFVFTGIKVFANTVGAYIPGPYYGHGGDPQVLYFFDWLWSPNVVGPFMFMVITAIVMWVMIKYGGSGKK